MDLANRDEKGHLTRNLVSCAIINAEAGKERKASSAKTRVPKWTDTCIHPNGRRFPSDNLLNCIVGFYGNLTENGNKFCTWQFWAVMPFT
jgi:hypothetical protein